MKFNIIGAGRLGKNLAHALVHSHLGELIAVCNQSIRSSEEAIREIGKGRVVRRLEELPQADLIFITSKDDAISNVATTLAKSTQNRPGTVVAHCSGVLSSAELAPLHDQGCLVASLHPLRAFPRDIQANVFQDCECVIEGDALAVQTLTSLFETLGASLISIQPKNKATYHAAATMAANYLVTLAHAAEQLFHEAGISERNARQVTQKLMQTSLDNLKHTENNTEALTGPLARGDVDTVSKHMSSIKDSTLYQLYCSAALSTLPLAQINDEAKASLQNLFYTNSHREAETSGSD